MNTKNLIEQFEKEVWLFIDGDLPDERNKFWLEELKRSPQLAKILEETKDLDNYLNKNLPMPEIETGFYNSSIEKALSQKQNSPIIRFLHTSSIIDEVKNFKIFLSATAAAAAIIFMLILPAENINAPDSQFALKWNDPTLENQISKLDDRFSAISTDELKENIFTDYNLDNWDRSLSVIFNKIQKIENDIVQTNL